MGKERGRGGGGVGEGRMKLVAEENNVVFGGGVDETCSWGI